MWKIILKFLGFHNDPEPPPKEYFIWNCGQSELEVPSGTVDSLIVHFATSPWDRSRFNYSQFMGNFTIYDLRLWNKRFGENFQTVSDLNDYLNELYN